MVKVKRLFKANCGPGARYISHTFGELGEFKAVIFQFAMEPEGRVFNSTQVIRGPSDSDLEVAVLKVAAIARDIREHVKQPERVN